MCKHGTLTKVTVLVPKNNGLHEVYVDSCLAPEIQDLNDKGVKTINSCCGHGRIERGDLLIDSDSKDLAKSLGYDPVEYTPEHTAAGILRMNAKTLNYE